jgi:hypothetical protein
MVIKVLYLNKQKINYIVLKLFLNGAFNSYLG